MVTRPIYGWPMLATARKLAVGSGPGRPALCDLRRATSTAYYALFHQLIRHGVLDFLPDPTEDELAQIARWFTHGGLLSASDLVLQAASDRPVEQLKRQDRTSVMAIRSACKQQVPVELIQIADAFQTLQSARHSADYDGNYDPVRAVTVNHVDDAEQAIECAKYLWLGFWKENERRLHGHFAYQTFLRLALLKSGGPKAR